VDVTRAVGKIKEGAGLCAWKFQYGENDRIIKLLLPDDREIDFTYDARGNVASLTSGKFNNILFAI
jgi:YD repeat-containing protein